jgi:copper homeostasis protein (lipoprotein)
LPYELASQGALEPLDVHLTIGGMFVYMADAARLTECRTGRSFPVAMEGDYRRLEKAYLEARQGPGQPLMMTFEGSIEERPRAEGGASRLRRSSSGSSMSGPARPANAIAPTPR